MLLLVQRVHISPGKALCRFCGEQVATNRLSTHIARKHPRPGRVNLSPTLVRKPAAAKKRAAK
jgi:phage FluMu protein Com